MIYPNPTPNASICSLTTSPSETVVAAQRLTNVRHWDDFWLAQQKRVHRLSRRHSYYGINGTFLKVVRATIGDVRGKNVLELGGGGTNYRLLALHKWAQANVTAIDYSQVSLDILRRLFQQNEGTVDAVHSDFFACRPTAKYDVVFHIGVLEHFDDPLPLLQLSSSWLREGGKLLFTMPNMEAWAARLWKAWSPDNWSKHILHDQALIERSCLSANLQLRKSFHFGYPFLYDPSWEKNGMLPFLVSRLQKIASLTGRIFPFYHRIGGKRVSMERGFYAERRPSIMFAGC